MGTCVTAYPDLQSTESHANELHLTCCFAKNILRVCVFLVKNLTRKNEKDYNYLLTEMRYCLQQLQDLLIKPGVVNR